MLTLGALRGMWVERAGDRGGGLGLSIPLRIKCNYNALLRGFALLVESPRVYYATSV